MHQKGAQIVGAIDRNPKRLGRDIGEVANLGRPLGIHVRNDPDALFSECDADICVIATTSLMVDMEPIFALVARHRVNAISICEESFFPWTTAPQRTHRLDKLAWEHGCTLMGSGYQDVLWGSMITGLAGSSHRIDRIEDWSLRGEPDTQIKMAKPASIEVTCATVVNRLPDVLSAPPGFFTTDKLPPVRYQSGPLVHPIR